MGVLTQHMFVQPATPQRASPARRDELGALEDITMACLAKKPEDRYASMDRARRRHRRGRSARRRRRTRISVRASRSGLGPCLAKRSTADGRRARATDVRGDAGGHRRRSPPPGPRRPRPWLYIFCVGAFGGLGAGRDRRCAMAPRARRPPAGSVAPDRLTPAAPLRLPPAAPQGASTETPSVSPAAGPDAPSVGESVPAPTGARRRPSVTRPRRRANWTTWATLSRQNTDATRPALRKGGGSRREKRGDSQATGAFS